MKITITYIAWPLLGMAILAWSAVGVFAWTIAGDESDRAFNIQNVEEAESKEATAVRLHAIARDTAANRLQLDTILHADVVSVVDMIEAVGKASGVKVMLSDAVPEKAPSSQAAGGSAVMTVGFVVKASGKFSSLMHAIRLFETLPLPSTVVRLDIGRANSASPDSAGSWNMNVYIRVLTTSDISS